MTLAAARIPASFSSRLNPLKPRIVHTSVDVDGLSIKSYSLQRKGHSRPRYSVGHVNGLSLMPSGYTVPPMVTVPQG